MSGKPALNEESVRADARNVLATVRSKVEAGLWVKYFWSLPDGRCCLHKHLAIEVSEKNQTCMPTPLDGRVFYAIWKALPEWANSSIPIFNDAWGTTEVDVLAVLDKAAASLDDAALCP